MQAAEALLDFGSGAFIHLSMIIKIYQIDNCGMSTKKRPLA